MIYSALFTRHVLWGMCYCDYIPHDILFIYTLQTLHQHAMYIQYIYSNTHACIYCLYTVTLMHVYTNDINMACVNIKKCKAKNKCT